MTPIELAADHLWQSTAVTLALGLLTLAFRRHRAQVRYGLWLAASAKFLLPFAVLVALGSQLGSLLPAPAAPPAAISGIVDAAGGPVRLTTGGAPALEAAASAASQQGLPLWLVLPVVWMVGVVAVLAVWLTRWRRVAVLARRAARVELGREWEVLDGVRRREGGSRPVVLALSDAPLEPGVFGVRRPVLLWPRHISARLDDEQMAAIMAHELAHVRRRDNLVAALHMAVQALFWFHPIVWWIGTRLVAERERACDEAAVAGSRSRRLYAESLLETCRFSVEAPLACMAGVTGSSLTRRIEAIMHSGSGVMLSRWRKSALVAAGALAVTLPVAIGTLTAPRLAAQSPADRPAERFEFEVASVRPSEADTPMVRIQLQPGGRYNAVNVTLQMLILNAYQVQQFQIVDGPDWLGSERFDIVAKAENDPGPASPAEAGPIQLMVRSLLEDRFKLVVHTETREMPIYTLVRAREDGELGPQLTPSTVDCRALFAAARRGGPPPAPPQPGDRPGCGVRMGFGTLAAGSMPLSQIAQVLSPQLARIVVDRTGLEGNFDLELRWAPDQLPGGGFGVPPPGAPLPPVDPDAPSLFTAVQEQLGLKLESERGPVDVLVIDGAEMPTPD